MPRPLCPVQRAAGAFAGWEEDEAADASLKGKGRDELDDIEEVSALAVVLLLARWVSEVHLPACRMLCAAPWQTTLLWQLSLRENWLLRSVHL